MSSSRVGQNSNISESSCNPRVLILENDSLATKLNFLEQTFELKMEALKVKLEKRQDKSEENFCEKITKQKDYVYDKIYELKSLLRSPSNYHSQKDCSKKIEDVIKEQDRFNKKLSNVEKHQQNICSQIPAGVKELQKKIKSREEFVQEENLLNSSMTVDENDLSTKASTRVQ